MVKQVGKEATLSSDTRLAAAPDAAPQGTVGIGLTLLGQLSHARYNSFVLKHPPKVAQR